MTVRKLMIAAASSGSGKTVIACALMAAFQGKEQQVSACKCGPDYIDPMFHREVLGIESENLDLYFCEADVMRRLFKEHIKAADVVIVEGVMGYYDGLTLSSDKASSYEVADKLGLPVILVVPCKGMALSVMPLILGMLEFRENNHIQGMILNRVSDMLYPRMKEMVESELLKRGYEIPVVGYVPENEVFALESRHLGLVTPKEIEGIRDRLKKAGEILTRTVDIERLLEIGGRVDEAEFTDNMRSETRKHIDGNLPEAPSTPVRIGIASDKAFCFYYKDNLELMKRLGCELIPFSPLYDNALPQNLHGLLFGGGYPELFAETLSNNQSMLKSVSLAVREGMPCLAECGGFMYLHDSLEGKDRIKRRMVGVVPGSAFRTDRLVRFGYVELRAQKDGTFFQKGDTLKGHEFHYWDSTSNGADCMAYKPDGKRFWECIHMEGNLFAGFPHIHFYSNPDFAIRFTEACKSFTVLKKE